MEHSAMNLDKSFQHCKVKVSYPHITVPNAGNEFSLVYEHLDKDENGYSIVLSVDGCLYVLPERISISPLNLEKLRSVYKFIVRYSPTDEITITTAKEMLEGVYNGRLTHYDNGTNTLSAKEKGRPPANSRGR